MTDRLVFDVDGGSDGAQSMRLSAGHVVHLHAIALDGLWQWIPEPQARPRLGKLRLVTFLVAGLACPEEQIARLLGPPPIWRDRPAKRPALEPNPGGAVTLVARANGVHVEGRDATRLAPLADDRLALRWVAFPTGAPSSGGSRS
jgi:hypothetical protein